MRARVLPAYAGMIRLRLRAKIAQAGAPRVCGDDLKGGAAVIGAVRCSPRMRG